MQIFGKKKSTPAEAAKAAKRETKRTVKVRQPYVLFFSPCYLYKKCSQDKMCLPEPIFSVYLKSNHNEILTVRFVNWKGKKSK